MYICTDESYLTNGYLETVIDWIPEMKGIRLKDLPTNVWTTDPNDKLFRFTIEATQNSGKVSNIIVHTFDEFRPVLLTLSHGCFPTMCTPSAQCSCFLTSCTEKKQKQKCLIPMDTAYGKKNQSVSSGSNQRSQTL